MSQFFFFHQKEGVESPWKLDSSADRARILETVKPAFSTVLDLTTIPLDNDWSKVRYQGPFYADFDADGDLELACESYRHFLLKLSDQLDFDLTQARFWATGSKGFHVEVPAECFMAKVPPTGTAWLSYIYRTMAEQLVVDTLDFNVYHGKRGNQWRTPNVRRSNGCYKVEISLEEAMGITPELYLELIKEPRPPITPTPPSCNSKFAVLFFNAKEKIVSQMRGKKKRQTVANATLDPWRAAKKTPPTIEGLMDGTLVAQGAGFQSLAMQLAIYATSVEMPLDEFLDRCKGLIASHVGDGRRYASEARRREELSRMHDYMLNSSLYDFDAGPLRKLVVSRHVMSDLGSVVTEDTGDAPAQASASAQEAAGEGDEVTPAPTDVDLYRGLRKGFFMNADGMWRRVGDQVEPICRATLRNVEAFFSAEDNTFNGYEFDVVQKGAKSFRVMVGCDVFTSASNMKKFFINHQIAFQGGDMEAMSLSDIMAEKSRRSGRVYTYPREGFQLITNPHAEMKELVKVYLTKDYFHSSIPEDDPAYFRLKYRPTQATSSYNIDIHKAPELGEQHRGALHDLFSFTREDLGAKLIGWFVAAMYRSVYQELFLQFPLLQIYGEAGAGKSQTVWMLAHLHWYLKEISIKSAAGLTPFAVDNNACTSTSAPFILDEFKPREMRLAGRGKYEKLVDLFRSSYNSSDVGERGTLNKGAETNLSVIKNRATAPICFMGEAIEMQTAIIERSVLVNLTKQTQTKQRTAAFNRLHDNPEVLSSLGRELLMIGFTFNLEGVRQEVNDIRSDIEESMPPVEDEEQRRGAPRMIYNRAVIVHALRTLRHTLRQKFGGEFDASVESLLATLTGPLSNSVQGETEMTAMSEVSKVMNRIALLSRAQGDAFELFPDRDYILGDGWIELRLERAYDQYRRYCSSINDSPLFDSIEAFIYGMNAYTPCIDRNCASSELRKDGSTERIVRLSLKRLKKEGVQSFR